MPHKDAHTPPDALMLMGTRCPYCPSVLKALQALVKSGHIGKLETHIIEEQPEIARELGVRSVPWVRIGNFELEGLRSEKELREWAIKASTGTGMSDWLNDMLASGNIIKPLERIRSEPAAMTALLELFTDPDTALNTQIGISAIMEDLKGTQSLNAIIDQLGELTQHSNSRIRGDACHYLSLSGNPAAEKYIRPLLDDKDGNVRDIARDSLDQLKA
jgi:glutaredoxin